MHELNRGCQLDKYIVRLEWKACMKASKQPRCLTRTLDTGNKEPINNIVNTLQTLPDGMWLWVCMHCGAGKNTERKKERRRFGVRAARTDDMVDDVLMYVSLLAGWNGKGHGDRSGQVHAVCAAGVCGRGCTHYTAGINPNTLLYTPQLGFKPQPYIHPCI